MKRSAFVLIAIATISIASFGGTSAAYPPDYPPNSGTLTLDPATPTAGEMFSATFLGCADDETVSFGFSGGGELTQATCADGEATVTFMAPVVPGEYRLGVFSFESQAGGSFPVVVVPVALPATGSDGVSEQVVVAVGLLGLGIGLLGVAQVRRRRELVAR